MADVTIHLHLKVISNDPAMMGFNRFLLDYRDNLFHTTWLVRLDDWNANELGYKEKYTLESKTTKKRTYTYHLEI